MIVSDKVAVSRPDVPGIANATRRPSGEAAGAIPAANGMDVLTRVFGIATTKFAGSGDTFATTFAISPLAVMATIVRSVCASSKRAIRSATKEPSDETASGR
jgi:hypothetical protein